MNYQTKDMKLRAPEGIDLPKPVKIYCSSCDWSGHASDCSMMEDGALVYYACCQRMADEFQRHQIREWICNTIPRMREKGPV